MALGALVRSGVDIAISVTGTAESKDEMSGVVCFGCAAKVDHEPKVLTETQHFFDGERNAVRKAAAYHTIFSIPVLLRETHC